VQDALGFLLFLLFPGCMVWMPFFVLAAGYCVVTCGNVILQALAATALAAAVFWPVTLWKNACYSRLALLTLRYTSMVLAWETPLHAPDARDRRAYMFVAPPHGLLPVGNILIMLGFPVAWGFHFRGLTTNAALRLPLMRHVMAWVGCVDASSATAAHLLARGESIGLCPGGVAEIFDAMAEDEVLYIKKRKGFVKLALRTGTPIVPCYVFGNTELLKAWYDEGGVCRRLSRRVGFGVVAIWGRLGLPVIFRRPVLAVTGAPIEVPPPTLEPSAADIDRYHALFVERLRELFDKYKGAYGWGHKQLVIR
ncbi:unnamed protein product, partial [Phaeothamnion confervicola]